jgi:hypothetical protein
MQVPDGTTSGGFIATLAASVFDNDEFGAVPYGVQSLQAINDDRWHLITGLYMPIGFSAGGVYGNAWQIVTVDGQVGFIGGLDTGVVPSLPFGISTAQCNMGSPNDATRAAATPVRQIVGADDDGVSSEWRGWIADHRLYSYDWMVPKANNLDIISFALQQVAHMYHPESRWDLYRASPARRGFFLTGPAGPAAEDLTGAVTLSGTLAKLVVKGDFLGSLTPTGVRTAQTQKSLAGALSLVGASVLKKPNKGLTGSVTESGSLTTLPAFGPRLTFPHYLLTLYPEQYQEPPQLGGPPPQTKGLTGSFTVSGALTRQVFQNRVGSLTPAGVLVKSPSLAKTGSLTLAGALAKLGKKQSLAGSLTPAGVLAKTETKPLAGAVTLTGTLAKKDNKALTGAATLSGGAISRLKVALVTLTGSLTPSGVLAKKGLKGLTGAASLVGSFVKVAAKPLTGAVTPSGTFSKTKVSFKSLVGSLSLTASFTRSAVKRLSGSLSPAGSFAKTQGKQLPGQLVLAGSAVAKTITVPLVGAVGLAGSVVTKAVAKAFTGLLTLVGLLVKEGGDTAPDVPEGWFHNRAWSARRVFHNVLRRVFHPVTGIRGRVFHKRG